MKFVFLTPGTGGWHCGACMRDNALATALLEAGHEVSLLPMYLPLHLDEPTAGGSAAEPPLFFGGITVYLRQRFGWFRHAPRWLTRRLDHPGLLRRVARHAGLTNAASHGAMTLAMLRFEETRLQREFDQLASWLEAAKPDLLCLSTVLQAGLIRPLKQRLSVRIAASFQGEDSFLDALPPPYRDACWRELAIRVREADALVAPSRYYAELMRQRLGPDTPEFEVIPNGINLTDFPAPRPAVAPVIGFLARLCHHKGLALMVDAFIHLRGSLGHASARLHLAGAATAADQALIDTLRERIAAAGLNDSVHWQPNLSREDKLAMLSGLHVFSVPALYPEAFGLYLIEALAAGVPVVQPRASAFPEILAAAGTGTLVEPGDPVALAEAWQRLLGDPDSLAAMAVQSRDAAERCFAVGLMRDRFVALAKRLAPPREPV